MSNSPSALQSKLLLVIFICAFTVVLQNSCSKREVKSPAENQQKSSTDLVLNFKFTTPEKNRTRGKSEIPLSSVLPSTESNAQATAARIGGCGTAFNGSHSGAGYFMYPTDTMDLSLTVEGSTINMNVDAIGVPNRFTIYNANTGSIVASSPWMGSANYSGPWGQSLNTSPTGTLTFTRGSTPLYLLKVETSIATTSDSYSTTFSCTAPSFISKVYAGITIKYYSSTGLLQFSSTTDFSSVLDTLDARYETYNANYENMYPTLTPDQLDSVDLINNFDEFTTFRQFEALFTGYSSKRGQVEGIENTWLSNDFTGTDPDDVDPTFDDAENTIANLNSKVIVGTTTYDLADTSGGGASGSSFAASANMVAAASSGGCSITFKPACFTNRRKRSGRLVTPDGSRSFICKVGIHAWCIRTGVKGKVVSFKRKNGHWKRGRMKLAINIAGNIYDNACTSLPPALNIRNPSPTGYKNRKQLKIARHAPLQTWKTKTGELATSFDAQNVATGSVGF